MTKNINRSEIAGAIVLYNPTIENLNNIESYINDVDVLFAIDNSEKPKKSTLEFLTKYSNVKYISLNKNSGIAYALNTAAKNAIDKAFRYLLTMDQDSRADNNMVMLLYKAITSNANIGITAPIHINKYNTREMHKSEIVLQSTKTSGNLVNLKILSSLGMFKEEYFIDYVDIEYCTRLIQNNFKIIEVGGARLFHNEANIERKTIFRKAFYVYNHNPVRIYYKTRNLLYFRKEYKIVNKKVVKIESNFFIKNILKMFLFEKNRLQKFYYMLKGIKDYFLGRKFKLH